MIAAPTGIAAMNAQGVTINSLFQIRPGYFLRGQQHIDLAIYDPQTILTNLNYSASKTEVLRNLEVLIIDEVSMVRSDQVDLMHQILQKVRKNHQPFGGVQVVFLGDLFQLPPVVTSGVLKYYEQVYQSPYFFQAAVLCENPLLKIEFTEIFRQSDQSFINILNNIRYNQSTASTLEILNRRYCQVNNQKDLIPFITITSHLEKAAQINHQHLSTLPGPAVVMEAEIAGNVNPDNFPVDEKLILKKEHKS